jgi:transposase
MVKSSYAAKICDIHKNAFSRWNVRKSKEGTVLAKARLGFRSKVNKQELEDFVRSDPNIKLRGVGKKFGIAEFRVGRILKKLGFSYKKNLYLLGSK